MPTCPTTHVINLRQSQIFNENLTWQDQDGVSYDLESLTGRVYFTQQGETVIEGELQTFATLENGQNFSISLTSEQTLELETGDYRIIIIINNGDELPEVGDLILKINPAL